MLTLLRSPICGKYGVFLPPWCNTAGLATPPPPHTCLAALPHPQITGRFVGHLRAKTAWWEKLQAQNIVIYEQTLRLWNEDILAGFEINVMLIVIDLNFHFSQTWRRGSNTLTGSLYLGGAKLQCFAYNYCTSFGHKRTSLPFNLHVTYTWLMGNCHHLLAGLQNYNYDSVKRSYPGSKSA